MLGELFMAVLVVVRGEWLKFLRFSLPCRGFVTVRLLVLNRGVSRELLYTRLALEPRYELGPLFSLLVTSLLYPKLYCIISEGSAAAMYVFSSLLVSCRYITSLQCDNHVLNLIRG